MLHLHTSRHQLQLAIGGIGVTEVKVSDDQGPCGSVVPRGDDVWLLDSSGREVGRYRRHPISVLGIRAEVTWLDPSPYYGPVEIGGRVVAELNRNPLVLRGQKADIEPLRHVVPDLTEEEQRGLLMLIGWEIYTKSLTRR